MAHLMIGPALDAPPPSTRSASPVALDWDGEKFLDSYRLLFGQGQAMWAVESVVLKAADCDAPVCIEGEPGTGKEMAAKVLHCLRYRAGRAWLSVRCASPSEKALECQLFGDDGTFEADPLAPQGVFELGRGGTVFLDEIGHLPPRLQARLLRAIQFSVLVDRDRCEPDSTQPRLIVATSRDLRAAVAAGAFSEDLYHRLNVLRVSIPPLRERRDEIPALIAHFTKEFCRQAGRSCPEISARTMDLLLRYAWPGNVRELESLVEAYVRSGNERALRAELGARLDAFSGMDLVRPSRVGALDGGLRSIAMRAAREAEEAALKEVLVEVRWNRAEAARRLKVSRKTLGKKLRALGLTPTSDSTGSE